MSREIKFRAWDKKQKKMLYGVSIGTIKVWDENAPLISHEFSYSEDCIFEQYTGLKDNNGKEIYEGDLVRTTDRVTDKGLIFPIGVVEFGQQAFWICNVPSERPDFTHSETLLQYWETDLEVIGNIHEPPKDFRPEHLKRMGISISKGGEE